MALDLLSLNRVDDAATVLAEADRRKFEADSLLEAGYFLAFLRNDAAEMQRILVHSSDVPGAQEIILARQANTEAYHGKFEKADELSTVAASLMQHDGDKESAATCLAEAAIREALVGNARRAHKLVAQAQNLSRGQDIITLTAVVAAHLGDLEQVEALSQELNRESPNGTLIQKYWLPLIRSQMGRAPPLEYSKGGEFQLRTSKESQSNLKCKPQKQHHTLTFCLDRTGLFSAAAISSPTSADSWSEGF
jgi:eukaryotic-like serine/threonine-protein kinase